MKKSQMHKDFSMKSKLRECAHGGHITGPGGPTDDVIPAMLSDGEYVLPADTVRAIGKENLDRLRAATHKKPKKMADGGFLDVPDDEYLKRATKNIAVDDPLAARPAAVKPQSPKLPLGQRVAGVASKLALPALGVAGAVQAGGTPTSDYAERFGVSPRIDPNGTLRKIDSAFGIDEKTSQAAYDTLLRAGGVASDVLDVATLGLAGNFYKDKQRSIIPSANAAESAPFQPKSPSQLRGQTEYVSPYSTGVGEQGERAFTDGQPFNGPSVVPFSEGTQRLERANAINASMNADLSGGSTLPDIGDQEASINQRYDAAAQQIAKAYSGRGLRNFRGRSARYQAGLEQDRDAALGNLRRDNTLRRGQDMDFALGGAKLRADMAGDSIRNNIELMKLARGDAKDKVESLQKAFDGMFYTQDDKGRQVEDKQRGVQYKDFILRADPMFANLSAEEASRKLDGLSPYEQAVVLSRNKVAFEMNERANEAQRSNMFFGQTSDRMDPIVGERELTIGDYSRGVPASDIAGSYLNPFAEDNVVITESGRAVRKDRVLRDELGAKSEMEEQLKRRRRLPRE